MKQTFIVKGMKCDGCVNSVKTALSAVSGVKEIDIDLESGRVELETVGPIPTHLLAAAVENAGYAFKG